MRLLPRVVSMVGLALTVLGTSAHIGSPDTWFQGNAGPYPVQVVVRLPGVVPGLGQIDVRVEGDDVARVTTQPVIYNAGPGGAPPADDAVRVPGAGNSWHAELWFMTQASFSVKVRVEGARGSGVVTVPVAALAERQVPLYPWLGKLMLVLGILLFIGAVTIIRAAATDAVALPAEATSGGRRGIVPTLIGTALLVAIGFAGRAWWQAVDQEYRGNLYRPTPAMASVETTGDRRMLRFVVADSGWLTQRSQGRGASSLLVPDHGKLMHLFLVQQGGGAGFAHLHPVSEDTLSFSAALGTLPEGEYHAYADVTHETGLSQTLVATVRVPAPLPGDVAGSRDADDVIFAGVPGDNRVAFSDGSSVTWELPADGIAADADARLHFTVRGSDGAMLPLDPYLGMAGHAVVQRADGGVYIHLHPNGTVSAAAQRALETRLPSDSVPGTLAKRLSSDGGMHAMHGMTPAFDGTLRFPYAFPTAGEYRVWVQFRRNGEIRTAPFKVVVGAAREASSET